MWPLEVTEPHRVSILSNSKQPTWIIEYCNWHIKHQPNPWQLLLSLQLHCLYVNDTPSPWTVPAHSTKKTVPHLIDTPSFLSKLLLPENTKIHFRLAPKELTRLKKSNWNSQDFSLVQGWEQKWACTWVVQSCKRCVLSGRKAVWKLIPFGWTVAISYASHWKMSNLKGNFNWPDITIKVGWLSCCG